MIGTTKQGNPSCSTEAQNILEAWKPPSSGVITPKAMVDGAFLKSLFTISDSSIKKYPKANLFYEITKNLILTNTLVSQLAKDFIKEDKIFVESEAKFKNYNGSSFIESNDTLFHVFLRASLIFKEEINKANDENLKDALYKKYTEFRDKYLFFLYFWKIKADYSSQNLLFDTEYISLKSFSQFNDSIFLQELNLPPCNHIVEAIFNLLSNKTCDKETIKNLIRSRYFEDFRFMEDSTEGYGTEYSDYEVKVKVGDSLIDVFKKIISNYYEELETNSSISPESTIFFENIKFILDELKNKGNLFRENFLTSVIAASIWEQSCPSKEINYGINV